MTSSLVADVPTLQGLLTKETLETYVVPVQKGKNAMPGFELSFDAHDTRRVLRAFVRRLTEKAPETEKDGDEPDPALTTPEKIEPSGEK